MLRSRVRVFQRGAIHPLFPQLSHRTLVNRGSQALLSSGGEIGFWTPRDQNKLLRPTPPKPPQALALSGLSGRTVVCSKRQLFMADYTCGDGLADMAAWESHQLAPSGRSWPQAKKRSGVVFSSIGESSRDMLSASTKIEESIFSVSQHLQKTVPHAWVSKPQGSLTSVL